MDYTILVIMILQQGTKKILKIYFILYNYCNLNLIYFLDFGFKALQKMKHFILKKINI